MVDIGLKKIMKSTFNKISRFMDLVAGVILIAIGLLTVIPFNGNIIHSYPYPITLVLIVGGILIALPTKRYPIKKQ